MINGASKRLLYNGFHRNHKYSFWQFGNNENLQNTGLSSNNVMLEKILIETSEFDEDNNIELSLEEFTKEIEKHNYFLRHIQEEYKAGNFQHVKALLKSSK
ncbi:24347_t:CDS:1 [Cetraspora pellucida]|uniref:24347_t:CDS:1 n=1 Tax=Cetraspora pellucida TaxID=1433469 RepID=A0A9N8Z665_9GLOM|nr:24347_t:CDS:1 [Cetraspora pellucida]